MAVSGSSHAVAGFGGRGIGRAAVHEFNHVFLGSADFHDGEDRATYEFSSASRREQYYGELRWGRARPLLERRFTR